MAQHPVDGGSVDREIFMHETTPDLGLFVCCVIALSSRPESSATANRRTEAKIASAATNLKLSHEPTDVSSKYPGEPRFDDLSRDWSMDPRRTGGCGVPHTSR